MGEKVKMKLKRNANVELLRIAACFIVIGTHVKLTQYIEPEGALNLGQIIISSFFGEGVTIFFMIFGFFMFNSNNFKQLCTRTLTRIIFPALIYIIVIQFLKPWINGECSLLDIFYNMDVEFYEISSKLLMQNTNFPLGEHLWYVISYAQLILIFPLLKGLKENKKERVYIVCLCIVAIILIDIQKIIEFPIGIKPIVFLITPAIISLLGYELYQKRDNLQMHQILWSCGGISLYILGHIVGILVHIHILQNNLDVRFAWDSIISIISSSGLVIVFLSASIKKQKISELIIYISSRCYLIYLIHYSIIIKLKSLSVYDYIYKNIVGDTPKFFYELLFTIAITLMVYFFSFLISDIILRIVGSIRNRYANKKITI